MPDHPFHPERVSEAYAAERIRDKISRFPSARQRRGLRALDADLRARGVAPAVRLHLVSAVVGLGLGRAPAPRARIVPTGR